MNPYEPLLEVPPKNHKQHDQEARSIPAPDLDDDESLMSDSDLVIRPSEELEALLASPHIHDPFPYPGEVVILPSYISEPPESAHSINLRKQVKHALENTCKFDLIGCSVSSAFQLDRDPIGGPDHGLKRKERCWMTGEKFEPVKKARKEAPVDYEQAMKHYESIKNLDNEVLSFNDTNLDHELEEFYGPDGTDLRPIDNNSDDEGFSEPHPIATTMVSLPDKCLLEEGVTPGGIFQDSGICMDEGYAEYSLAHSFPNTAKEPTRKVPSDWPTFDADLAPLRTPKYRGRWLRLVGDQKQCGWPGRRQGPYGLWARASKSDDGEIIDEHEVGDSDSQDGSSTPQTDTRETSVSHDVEAAVDNNIKVTSSRISTALAVAEYKGVDQMVKGPSVDTSHGNPMPAEGTSPIQSMERAHKVSEDTQRKVNSKPFEATPRSFGLKETSPFHGSNENEGSIATPECINNTPVPKNDAANNEASIGVVRSVSEKRPQHFPPSIQNGSDNEPSVPVPPLIQGRPQVKIDANAQARRSIPATVTTTPVNQRIRQIQKVQVDTPATPETVNINLTPEYDSDISDMDAEYDSDGSLEVQLPDSPTTDTQKAQSALGRYVQETKAQPTLARHGSSTISLDGSESEEVLLIPTQERPSPSEGHAGFRKGVEFHQKKSDALFTLSPPKTSQENPSSRKTAPIPVTPAKGKDSSSFRPVTPFHLGPPAHPGFDSPGTPTPAPKKSKTNDKAVADTPLPKASKANEKSVMNIFKSPKLASRSPERANPSPDIVVAPTTPSAGAFGPHNSGSFGSQGLLFQKAQTNERGTKNVLNSLKLSPERARGLSARASLEDYQDELADEMDVEVYKGGRWVQESQPMMTMTPRIDLGANGGRKVVQAVVIGSKRSRDEEDEEVRIEEPRVKRARKSVRTARGADVPFFDHGY